MIPKALKDAQQWLLWRFEEKPGDKKPRKVPYYVNGKRRQGKQGGADDRGALTYFEAAVSAKSLGKYDGIGFAFLPDDGFIGIDLDNMVNPETGEIAPRALAIIEACASFTEYSPSRKGFHIYVRGAIDKSFKSNDVGVEVFCGAQFFTVTGEHYPGTPEEVAPITEAVINRLRATVKGAKKKTGSGPAPAGNQGEELDRAEDALGYLSPEDYHEWVEAGHALKASYGDAGFGAWDRWSARSAKYPGSSATRAKWETFNPSAITVGSIFDRAKGSGWKPKRSTRPRPARAAGGGDDGPPAFDGPPPDEPPGETPGQPIGRPEPVINWTAGDLPEIVDQAEQALLEAGIGIYQRTNMVVRVVRRDTPSVRNYKRAPGALGIVMVDQPHLIETFTRVARWQKWEARNKDWRRINAPEQVASTYLARSGHWKLPRLRATLSAPTLRPDGTVLQTPGYDEASQSWYDPCGVNYPAVKESPTMADVDKALELLHKAFGTFPFDTKVDEAVAMSLLLCALVRRSLPSAPLGAITAPVMASGKTLLADCIAIMASGVSAPAMKYPDSDEEAAKTALAVLAEGDPVVLIDNVERPLQGDWLCSVLTSETYRQRMLGRTEMMEVPTTTLWLATGNQLVIAGDLRTRALLCRLDPKVERPEQREFKLDLRQWMTDHRPQLVWAGLTVMRAHMVLGKPVAETVKPWGRFEHWSAMVRAPLVWLGFEDPCDSLKSLEDDDPERNEYMRLVHAWETCFKEKKATAREAIANAKEGLMSTEGEQAMYDILREIAVDRGGQFNVKRLSRWLSRHVGRRVKGRQLVKAGEENHVALWKVEKVH